MPNYYEILKVPPTANEDQIKAAYKKASLNLHPDSVARVMINAATERKQKRPRTAAELEEIQKEAKRNRIQDMSTIKVPLTDKEKEDLFATKEYKDALKNAEKAFKELGNAYEVLSDPNKKSTYDSQQKQSAQKAQTPQAQQTRQTRTYHREQPRKEYYSREPSPPPPPPRQKGTPLQEHIINGLKKPIEADYTEFFKNSSVAEVNSFFKDFLRDHERDAFIKNAAGFNAIINFDSIKNSEGAFANAFKIERYLLTKSAPTNDIIEAVYYLYSSGTYLLDRNPVYQKEILERIIKNPSVDLYVALLTNSKGVIDKFSDDAQSKRVFSALIKKPLTFEDAKKLAHLGQRFESRAPADIIRNNLTNQDLIVSKNAQLLLWAALLENGKAGGLDIESLSNLLRVTLYDDFVGKLSVGDQGKIIENLTRIPNQNKNGWVYEFLAHHAGVNKNDELFAELCANLYYHKKQFFEGEISLAQYQIISECKFNGQAHQVFNEYYFKQLKSRDQAEIIVSGLMPSDRPNKHDKNILAEVLKEDAVLFDQALTKLSSGPAAFKQNYPVKLKNLVETYSNTYTYSFNKSDESKTMAKLIVNFLTVKSNDPFTIRDKLALYLMIKSYMKNDKQNFWGTTRALAKELSPYYECLVKDIVNSGVLNLYEAVEPKKIESVSNIYDASLQNKGVDGQALINITNMGVPTKTAQTNSVPADKSVSNKPGFGN